MTTREQFRALLKEHGMSVRKWAEENGFSPANVRQVLYGKSTPSWGEKHRIARAIGMIPDPSQPLPLAHPVSGDGVKSTQ